jgi:hypothetical protein
MRGKQSAGKNYINGNPDNIHRRFNGESQPRRDTRAPGKDGKATLVVDRSVKKNDLIFLRYRCLGMPVGTVAGQLGRLSKIRYTLARPIPRRRAISVGRTPSEISATTSADRARAVGFRPLYLPSDFALAMPSR